MFLLEGIYNNDEINLLKRRKFNNRNLLQDFISEK